MDLFKKSGTELSFMLRSKECSAREIVSSIYTRIDSVEEELGSYVTLTRDMADKKADIVDKKIARGEIISPLAGIPVGVKDNILVKDIRNTCSSKMLENFVAPYNSTVVEKMLNQDCLIIGKLNMDEFAMGSSTETSYFKYTKNPHNLDCVPGGSSGGSASSVAGYQATVSLGSDTGGSVRQPASYCGIVGLKPTYSSVSRYGLVSFASSLDQIGPMGRTVKDVHLLYSAISGYDKKDRTTVDISNISTDISELKNLSGIKVGIPSEYYLTDKNTDVIKSIENFIKFLEKSGAEIKEVSLPNTKYSIPVYYILSSAEASSNLARFDGVKYGYRASDYTNFQDMYKKTRTEGFGEEVKTRIMLGTYVLSSGYYDAYYNRAQSMKNSMKQDFDKVFKECDIIVTPTTTTTAFNLGEKINAHMDMYTSDISTAAANITGIPAISIPCGRDLKGLPIGVQIMGKHFSEKLLFDVSNFYEKSIDGFDLEIKI